jgi:hypothetical protein
MHNICLRTYFPLPAMTSLLVFFSVDSSLPLMDEIGRRALTDAFIHFAKETGRRKRFLYNPAMDAFASPGSYLKII